MCVVCVSVCVHLWSWQSYFKKTRLSHWVSKHIIVPTCCFASGRTKFPTPQLLIRLLSPSISFSSFPYSSLSRIVTGRRNGNSTHTYLYTCMCTHICMHTQAHTCTTQVHICTRACTDTRAHICACTHMHAHIGIHMCIHTYTYMFASVAFPFC